jgi:hypothetical protein
MKFIRDLKNIGKPYMQGPDVREVQQLLTDLGFNPGKIDSEYGPITEKAVKAYQKASGLKRDGIVGTITWGALHQPKPCTATLAGRFVAWVIKQVGALYAGAGQGQVGSEALITKLEKNTGDRKRALASFFDHVKKGLSLIIYDCSGLIVKWLLDNKLISRDYNANGIYYVLCSAIERSSLQAGDLVFKKYLTSSRMYHVGVYKGDGTVVHAKGRDYGVVNESINATGWNRYGRLKALASAPAEGKPVATYTVVRGDTLSRIAVKMLGNKDAWRDIYELNKAVIGSNPGLIKPGMTLIMP